MKQFIKNGKIYNSPVIININGRKITSNSENYLKKFGYMPYEAPIVELTLEQRIENSDSLINSRTDEKILNDFTYNDNEFYLSTENQINFGNMFMAKDYLSYPQTIKTKTGYIQLNSAEEVTSFYLSGIQFVKDCLEECWAEKQAASAQIYADYQAELSASISEEIENENNN